ncbi:aspartate--tRNA ligase [Clostridium homopropionicum DSM 5847]|uniref:Aspartate--tRNA(Asp/Asn) ligase n=1 Tax=Clostridium homopropionicum DSM 5847 TaxID=1121318 RepID=A0A0L6ZD67_9CLOT|nr:aspartate--tRNA ligase [Clostridium homopropionicum]KOA20723.1 aspartate--tRNA ligase [Clostridium homopropionicum DSM 5847]SFF90666.1 aspartyl-tRNA synthetase [Clostridium homopropionicum]
MSQMYRSKTLNQISESDIGLQLKIAGWVENIRDHGGVSFIDLRDMYGVVQVVLRNTDLLNGIKKEECLSIEGVIEQRDEETYNPNIPSGTIELEAHKITILGKVYRDLPFEIATSKEIREDVRLKYRYLDLRNRKVKDNILFRSEVISFLRQKMSNMGFIEIQTPILSASSPEGARDYIVPSRKYKGKFYALPQAPQQYKQLLMVSGIDKYFQIAPCFRDEDSRADRSPGEFYQLDFEMSFATQEDVFRTGEEVLTDAFKKFAPEGYSITEAPYPIISYKQAMLEFGTDKPDLRNPLRIIDVTDFFQKCSFKPFHNKTVRALKVHAELSKGFHEKLLAFAQSIGMGGLGYLEVKEDLSYKGPIDKFIPDEMKKQLLDLAGLESGDVIFFIADTEELANKYAGQIRNELGARLDICEKNAYRFCYVNDFPMYEVDENTGKIGFTHNPFSMPQGGLEALTTKDPLDILAYQYDIVCNGVELSSGAVRNHDLDIMVKAFEIAGYDEETLKEKFGSLYNAFQFGAPPHAGMAPGVDRMIMLLKNEENIREVIAFPMSSNAQDLMCGAPNEVTEQQLREVHIKMRK